MSPRTALPTVLVLALVAVAASGCGRKGSLEPPGTPEVAAEPMLPTTVLGTIAAPPAPVEEPKRPDRPFILDPLI